MKAFISHTLHDVKSLLLLDEGVDDVEDRPEDWLGRRASNHKAIEVRKLNELVCVALGHAATIDDTHNLRLSFADVFTDPLTNEFCCLLCLVSTSNRASVQSPQWLVNKHDIGPVLDIGSLESLQLISQNLLIPLSFSVLFGLTKAVKDAQAAVLSMQYFLSDDFLSLSKMFASLRVTNHHVVHLIVFDVVSGHLTRIGTHAVGAAILCSNHDARLDD